MIIRILNITLNQLILSNSFVKKASLAFIVFILLIGLNCGKRKLPLPPIERIPQRAEISGNQHGNAVTILWILPENKSSDGNLLKIKRVDIYRLAEPSTANLTLSEEEFVSRSTLIATLPISDFDLTSKQLSYTDTLEFAGQSVRLRYAIRFVNTSGQKAAFSNFLLIEPTAKVANKPTSLTANVIQESIKLHWNVPTSNVDGSIPPNVLGYNIYKIIETNDSAQMINNAPILENKFADKSFEFGKEYKYFVRAISLGGSSEPVESLDSNIIEIKPVDTFAPSAPTAITIAAAPKNLSIFSAVNPERDIAGYKIYRSIDPNQPKPDWMLLNPELLTTNTFQDINVDPGKTYYYYLTAVDNAGNASEPSETVSETAP